jgi:hypothetical protein
MRRIVIEAPPSVGDAHGATGPTAHDWRHRVASLVADHGRALSGTWTDDATPRLRELLGQRLRTMVRLVIVDLSGLRSVNPGINRVLLHAQHRVGTSRIGFVIIAGTAAPGNRTLAASTGSPRLRMYPSLQARGASTKPKPRSRAPSGPGCGAVHPRREVRPPVSAR